VLLDGGERGTVSVSRAVLGALEKDDLLRFSGGKVALSATGVACARRLATSGEPFRGQHWEIERRVLRQGSEKEIVSATLSESPLAQLARRRTRNGEPFLTRAGGLAVVILSAMALYLVLSLLLGAVRLRSLLRR